MKWPFNNDRPIYAQIISHIERGIVTGEFPPGSTLPSVRVLAEEAEVNPNTMQKALADLESKGLLYTQRTAGRFVTEDSKMIENLKQDLAKDYISAFLTGMQSIGIDKSETVKMLKNELTERGLIESESIESNKDKKEVQ